MACLEIPQGRVWFTYICHYSTWATEVLSKCIVCPKGGCYSCATRPGDVTIYDLLWMYPTAPRYGCTPLPLTMGAMDVPHCPSLWVYPTAPHHGLVLPSVNYCISAWERLMVGLGFLPSRFLSEPPLFLITMCRLVLFLLLLFCKLWFDLNS